MFEDFGTNIDEWGDGLVPIHGRHDVFKVELSFGIIVSELFDGNDLPFIGEAYGTKHWWGNHLH